MRTNIVRISERKYVYLLTTNTISVDYDSDYEVPADSGKGTATADPYAGMILALLCEYSLDESRRHFLLKG